MSRETPAQAQGKSVTWLGKNGIIARLSSAGMHPAL
jgi:hypothetical protein